MITCPYCGRENAHEAVTCQECGTALEDCGTALELPGRLAQNIESTFKVFMTALLITIGISVACIIVIIATRFYLLLFVLFPGMPLWGTIEARRIRRRYFSVSSCWPTGDLAITLQCCRPVIVAFLCVLWWPLGFAAAVRPRLSPTAVTRRRIAPANQLISCRPAPSPP